MLPPERIRAILVERNGELGAIGGTIGGGAGGGIAGAVGGNAGGRMGGRLGARMLRIKGSTRVVGHSNARSLEAVRSGTRALPDALARPPGAVAAHAAVLGAGALDMNGAVAQVVWYPDRVEVTAHALEGIIDQRTADDAIDKIEALLASTSPD